MISNKNPKRSLTRIFNIEVEYPKTLSTGPLIFMYFILKIINTPLNLVNARIDTVIFSLWITGWIFSAYLRSSYQLWILNIIDIYFSWFGKKIFVNMKIDKWPIRHLSYLAIFTKGRGPRWISKPSMLRTCLKHCPALPFRLQSGSACPRSKTDWSQQQPGPCTSACTIATRYYCLWRLSAWVWAKDQKVSISKVETWQHDHCWDIPLPKISPKYTHAENLIRCPFTSIYDITYYIVS